MRKLRKVLLMPYTFVLMNWAAVTGLYYFARGCGNLWNPVQGPRSES